MRLFPVLSLWVIAGLTAGCPAPQPACRADADCSSYASCDHEVGACVLRSCSTDVECPGATCDTGAGHCIPPADGGVDGGGDAGVCPAACPSHQECLEGGCVARYQALSLSARESAGPLPPGAMVELQAELVLAAGRSPNPPDSIAVEVVPPVGAPQAAMLPRSGDSHLGTVTLGAADGEYRITASYGGLQSPEVVVRVDGIAPFFELVVPSAPARTPAGNTRFADPDPAYAQAWKLDETVTVQVRSTDADVDPSSVRLRGRFGSAQERTLEVEPIAENACGSGFAFCGRVALNPWEFELRAFRDELRLGVRGSDLAGNQSEEATATAKVTRWKWVHQASGSDAIRATPAIASNGVVIFGTAAGTGTSGQLMALHPSGVSQWPQPANLGAVVASPAVGTQGARQLVYVAANGAATGKLYALNASDGTVVHECAPPVNGAAAASVGILATTLAPDTTPHETATTVFAGQPAIVAIRPDGTLKCRDAFATRTANFPAAVATHGSDAFFGDNLGNVRAFSFNAGGWTEKWTVSPNLFTHALAIVGSDVVGGGGGPGKGGVFTLPRGGGVTVPPWAHETTSPAWNPVVDATGRAWVGLESDELLRVRLGNGAEPTTDVGGIVKGAPLLGEGGRAYLSTMNGTLSARSQTNPGEVFWSLSGLGELEASPTIDCARDSSGAKRPGPGTLYVASNSGRLHAFHVDSRGLDMNAAWPKYQRDPRNTGNAGTDLREFECP